MRVQLAGIGAARDVTANDVAASFRPFTVALSLEKDIREETIRNSRPKLIFYETDHDGAILGEIDPRNADGRGSSAHFL